MANIASEETRVLGLKDPLAPTKLSNRTSAQILGGSWRNTGGVRHIPIVDLFAGPKEHIRPLSNVFEGFPKIGEAVRHSH